MNRRKKSSASKPVKRTSWWRTWWASLAGATVVLAAFVTNIDTIYAVTYRWFGPSSAMQVDLVQQLATDEDGIGIGVDSLYPVSYASKRTEERLDIWYTSPYFDSSDTLAGMPHDDFPFFALPRVGLDVKLQNTSGELLYFSEAALLVQESTPIVRPMIVYDHSESQLGSLVFVNEGWAEPDGISLKANIPLLGGEARVVELIPDAYPVKGDGPVSNYAYSIHPLLEEFGFDTEAVRRYARLFEENAEVSDEDVRAEFYSLQRIVDARCAEFSARVDWGSALASRRGSKVAGLSVEDLLRSVEELDEGTGSGCAVPVNFVFAYRWRDEKGSTQVVEVVGMGLVNLTWPDGLGSGGFNPTGEYSVELRYAGRDYEVGVPISHPVDGGGVDRLTIWLGAKRSSNHVFRVVLRSVTGREVRSDPIKLDYLMPRSNIEYLMKETDAADGPE